MTDTIWQTTAVGNLIKLQNDKSRQIKSIDYEKSGRFPIVDQGRPLIGGYTSDESKKYIKGLPVIIFGDHTLHSKFINFDFAAGADGTQIIVPANESTNIRYLYYLILMAAQRIGSEGYKRHLKILKEFVITYNTNLVEQVKIADILTSVDDTIEHTQTQVAKLQDLKTATMNDLLTKGIGHTEFRESELGLIPTTWQVVRVGEVTESIVPGRNKPTSLSGEIPWITISDLSNREVWKSRENFGVDPDVLQDCGGKAVPKDSVILSVVGEFSKSSIAKSQIVINQQLHAFVCSDALNNYYLSYFINISEPQLHRLNQV